MTRIRAANPDMQLIALREGLPRRSPRAHGHFAAHHDPLIPLSRLQPDWQAVLPLVGLGGHAALLQCPLPFLAIVMTVVASRQPATGGMPVAEAMSRPENVPRILDQWWPWLAVAGGMHMLYIVESKKLLDQIARVWRERQPRATTLGSSFAQI